MTGQKTMPFNNTKEDIKVILKDNKLLSTQWGQMFLSYLLPHENLDPVRYKMLFNGL